MATIYLVSLGPRGLREVALQNLRKAAYAKERLGKVQGCRPRFGGPTFNEFVVRTKKRPAPLLRQLLRKQIIGGVDLGRFYPELADCLLLCVTEQKTRDQIDALCAALGGIR
jgi:glycine dehydrogenase subunit 1